MNQVVTSDLVVMLDVQVVVPLLCRTEYTVQNNSSTVMTDMLLWGTVNGSELWFVLSVVSGFVMLT